MKNGLNKSKNWQRKKVWLKNVESDDKRKHLDEYFFVYFSVLCICSNVEYECKYLCVRVLLWSVLFFLLLFFVYRISIDFLLFSLITYARRERTVKEYRDLVCAWEDFSLTIWWFRLAFDHHHLLLFSKQKRILILKELLVIDRRRTKAPTVSRRKEESIEEKMDICGEFIDIEIKSDNDKTCFCLFPSLSRLFTQTDSRID